MSTHTDIYSGGCILLAVIAICSITVIPFNFITRKNAEHVGYITAVEDNNGIILPDHTTTVYVKTELSSSQEDKYCVQDSEKELVEKLKKAAQDKKNVVIQYEGRQFTGLFNCDEDTIIGIKEKQQ